MKKNKYLGVPNPAPNETRNAQSGMTDSIPTESAMQVNSLIINRSTRIMIGLDQHLANRDLARIIGALRGIMKCTFKMYA